MGVVNPLTKEQAAPQVHGAFDKLAARAGKVPNIFAAMAHQPAVLNAFLPLYAAIVNQGTIEAKYKELAYLRTSMVNGCEYCTRAYCVVQTCRGHRGTNCRAAVLQPQSPVR